jgi:hypothetical protein
MPCGGRPTFFKFHFLGLLLLAHFPPIYGRRLPPLLHTSPTCVTKVSIQALLPSRLENGLSLKSTKPPYSSPPTSAQTRRLRGRRWALLSTCTVAPSIIVGDPSPKSPSLSTTTTNTTRAPVPTLNNACRLLVLLTHSSGYLASPITITNVIIILPRDC